MGKKKPFIDKKTASVYHVVRRSQRDVGTEATAETLSDFVLMASPDNAVREERRAREKAEEAASGAAAASGEGGASATTKGRVDFATLKSQIASSSLGDATAATYTKYTKPIAPGGKFISSTATAHVAVEDAENLRTLFTDTTKNSMDEALEEAMAVHEVGRMLDSIALTADCMEEDVAKALFDFEEEEFDEILDDFCFTANQEELEIDEDADGDNNGDTGAFNYEKHIQMLMEKARAQENGGGEGGRELEDDFFGGLTPLHGKIEEEDDMDDFDYDQYGEEEDEDSLDREFNGSSEKDALDTNNPTTASNKMNDEQQRILCQKFEEALLEYDSDDVGDLDEECEEICGDRPLEGDAHLEAALNEFLTEKEDEILIEGNAAKKNEKRTGGSGYSALVGKTMVNASELDNDKALLMNIEEAKKQMQKDLADADAVLANPEIDLPPEEILIDGKSYFSATPRNQFDCESILSTYSNLDNNPAVIGRGSRKKKKKGKKKNGNDNLASEGAIPEEGPAKIQLSNKTGLPLGVFDKNPDPADDYDDDGYDYYGDDTDTYMSMNRGEARNKAETKDEKKMRKMAVKEERKICRMQKKIMKEAFKEEFLKRDTERVVDAVGGNTVFRFS